MLGPMNFVANFGASLLTFWALLSLMDPVPLKKSEKVNKSTIPKAPNMNLRSCAHGAWPPGPSAMSRQFCGSGLLCLIHEINEI